MYSYASAQWFSQHAVLYVCCVTTAEAYGSIINLTGVTIDKRLMCVNVFLSVLDSFSHPPPSQRAVDQRLHRTPQVTLSFTLRSLNYTTLWFCRGERATEAGLKLWQQERKAHVSDSVKVFLCCLFSLADELYLVFFLWPFFIFISEQL